MSSSKKKDMRGRASTLVPCGSADVVREAVASFIEAQPEAEIGGTAICEWIQWESGGGVRAYCSRMRGNGEWGGAIEIAVFSRLFRTSVHVFERDGGEYKMISAFDHGGGGASSMATGANAVKVLYSGRVHYDALEGGALSSKL